MHSRNEVQMYPYVVDWLQKYLESLFSNAKISVYDTHASALNEIISRKGLQKYFDSNIWQTYDIRIDIAGFIVRKNRLDLAFIECKDSSISLSDLSQLLGYCRVANPLIAYLISNKGIGNTLNSLLSTYNRTDILEYHWERGKKPRRMLLAKWNETAKSIDFGTLLPFGAVANLTGIE